MNPSTLHLVTQPAVTRSADVAAIAAGLGLPSTVLPAEGWQDRLHVLETGLDEARPALFVSLQVAAYVERNCPRLARGLIVPRSFLRHSHYHALLPRGVALNDDGIYLPWARILPMAGSLKQLFPEGIFVRPDSPAKPFTGCTLPFDGLDRELRIMERSSAIQPHELCFITTAKRFDPHEFRVWMLDARPVCAASYSWDPRAGNRAVPAQVIEDATELGMALEQVEQVYTADFAIVEGRPKLVELNALSTSGWYPGLDAAALLRGLGEIFL